MTEDLTLEKMNQWNRAGCRTCWVSSSRHASRAVSPGGYRSRPNWWLGTADSGRGHRGDRGHALRLRGLDQMAGRRHRLHHGRAQVQFHGTLNSGAVKCVAELLHGGRTTQVWDATITNEDTGRAVGRLPACTQTHFVSEEIGRRADFPTNILSKLLAMLEFLYPEQYLRSRKCNPKSGGSGHVLPSGECHHLLASPFVSLM